MKKTSKTKKSSLKNKSVYEKVVVNECGTRKGALKHPPLYQMISTDDDVINGSES
jgi:hypothetical protein